MCTQAFYWNMWRLPPQYADFDDSHPFAQECPTYDLGSGQEPAAHDSSLYDVSSQPASPILEEITAVSGSPIAQEK